MTTIVNFKHTIDHTFGTDNFGIKFANKLICKQCTYCVLCQSE